jgi:hypothetical protein
MKFRKFKKLVNYKKITSIVTTLLLLISLGTSSLVAIAQETDSPLNEISSQLTEPEEENLEEEPENSSPIENLPEEEIVEDPEEDNEEIPIENSDMQTQEEEIKKEEQEVWKPYSTFGFPILQSIMQINSSEPLEYVDPEENGLILSKTASVFGASDADGRQIFKIDLTAEATSNIVTSDGAGDIVLILDNSSSLNGNMDMSSGDNTVENGLKTAAKDFVDNLAQIAPTSKMVVINSKPSGTTSTDWLTVGTQKTDLENEIDAFNPSSRVAVDNGLSVALSKFNSLGSPTRPRYVLLIAGHSNWGNGSSEYGFADSLKGIHGTIIYTIGIYDKANALDPHMWNVSSNNPYPGTLPGGFSPVPNDPLPNGSENHYKTTDTFQGLSDIFGEISEQLGETLENAVVRDYIDQRFDVVDDEGNVLDIGDTLTIGNNTGTLKTDTNGVYMEWPPQMIAPETSEGAGDEVVFQGSLYIKPKPDFIGGNNIPTNIKNISAVYVINQEDDEIKVGSFPNPLVNVPFKLNITDIEDTIFLGEGIPRSKSTAQGEMIEEELVNYDYPNGMLDYTWDPDYADNDKPENTTDYDLTITATPIDYIVNPDDTYHPAVGTLATEKIVEGTYTVIVIPGTLTIKKTIDDGEGQHDPNQTFVFEIKQFEDMGKTTLVKTFYETIRVINGSTETREIINLPKGYYEVEEKTDWSWQYDPVGAVLISDTLGMDENGDHDINKDLAVTSFENKSKPIKWLTSIDWVINKFIGGDN